MYLKSIIFIIVIISLAVLVWKALSFRRNLPFQEIIPLDSAIAVINTQNWYPDSLQITISSGTTSRHNKTFDKFGYCLLKNLENGKPYTIEIKRTDLKGRLLYKKLKKEVIPKAGQIKYVVLVGASVGKAWKFPKLTQRHDIGKHIVLSYRCRYDFDKSSELNNLLNAPFPVYAIIIKECSAYFPRDLKSSEAKIKTWVDQIRSHNIIPVLATVVPVTMERDSSSPGKFKSLVKFNDFIRDYAAQEGLPLLDLEAALRISDTDRHLRPDYAQPDGTHLVPMAYNAALDKIAIQLIKQLTEKPKN